MTLLVDDTFTGTNGSAPANWTLSGTTGFTANIQNNGLRLTPPATGSAYVRGFRTAPTTEGDLDLTVAFTFATAVTNEQYLFFHLHHSGAWSATAPGYPATGYSVSFIPGTTAADCNLHRANAANPTTVASASNGAITFAASSKVRFQAFRSTGVVRVKYWDAALAEPAAWLLTYTDPTPLPAGRVGVTMQNGVTTTVRALDVADLQVYDAFGTGAPPAGRKTEMWNGTALTNRIVEKWNGTALVPVITEL